MVYFNANGLPNKIDELKSRISKSKPDLIGITETHLSDRNDSSTFLVPGYTLYRSDRKSGLHGGVVLYVKSDIPSHQLQKNSDPLGEWESIWCCIQPTKSISFNIGCCYRIPSLAIPVHWPGFLSTLNHSLSSFSNILLMGDFNFPSIDWSSSQTSQSTSSASYEFLELLQDYDLTQHVTQPTRHRDGQQSSLLDLVISSPNVQISSVLHSAPLGRSDHDFLSFQIETNYNLNLPRLAQPNFRNADYVMLNDIFSSIDWTLEFEDLDVDSQLETLEKFIQDVIENYIPSYTRANNCNPPWYDKNIRSLVNKKKRAYSRLRNFPTPSNLAAYKLSRNSVVNSIRRARQLFEGRLIQNSKKQPKALFAYINRNKKTITTSCIKNSDGNILLEDEDITATFNKFFTSTLKPTTLSPPPKITDTGLVNFSTQDVAAALSILKEDKSCGPDKIPAVFLKNCASSLALPFYIIFNTSIRTCIFPARWKDAHIVPIHKSGSHHDVQNYRPISLLSVVSKILERFVHCDLLLQCKDLNIIPESQHGFLPGRSCLSNLLDTYNYITQLVDAGVSCDMLFLDFKKAFDSVPHAKLINKLSFLKFPPTTITWIHSYLHNRRQRVCLRGTFSDWTPVTSGVPQGSVLGPLLFNIYMSDLSRALISKNNSYADDLKLCSPSFLSTTLQSDLQNISDWTISNGLELNPDKCAVMYFGHNNPHYPYHFRTKIIASKSSHPDLGILIDDSLKFHRHADCVTAKVMKKAHYILKSFSHLTVKAFSILYKTFLRPVLEYCSQVGRPCYSSALARLESCQRRLTKWCKPLRCLTYNERLLRLNLPTVDTRLNRGDLILAFQILNNQLHVDPSDFFCFLSSNTRGHNARLVGSNSRLNVRHRFFTERVVSLWNSLPPEIVSAPTLNAFKNRLDLFL